MTAKTITMVRGGVRVLVDPMDFKSIDSKDGLCCGEFDSHTPPPYYHE